jgi:hypothetical protein
MLGGLTPAEGDRLLHAHPVEPGQAFNIETPDEGDVDEDIDDDLLLAKAGLRSGVGLLGANGSFFLVCTRHLRRPPYRTPYFVSRQRPCYW